MSDTPKTDFFKFKPEECVGYDTICSKDFARELERDNARLREALEAIVRGDYADGAERAHPAVALAKRALGILPNIVI